MNLRWCYISIVVFCIDICFIPRHGVGRAVVLRSEKAAVSVLVRFEFDDAGFIGSRIGAPGHQIRNVFARAANGDGDDAVDIGSRYAALAGSRRRIDIHPVPVELADTHVPHTTPAVVKLPFAGYLGNEMVCSVAADIAYPIEAGGQDLQIAVYGRPEDIRTAFDQFLANAPLARQWELEQHQ